MADRVVLWTVTDPRGLSITLTDDVWTEIVRKHSGISDQGAMVQATAQDPDEIYFDPDTSAKRTGARIYWYYKQIRPLPRRKFGVVIVKVVIADGMDQGYVQSAWTPERVQARLVSEWKK